MKIGILTFHRAHNYGAVLQAYALQQYLMELGHDVEIIDYKPQWIIDTYKVKNNWRRFVSINPLKCVKKIVSAIRYTYLSYKRYRRFDRFINRRLHLSSPLFKNRIPENYDAYFVGSDQIWNPEITGGFDDNYFAYFQFPKGNRRYISYAASMESSFLSDGQKEYYRSRLENLDYISVREEELSELIQPLTDKKVHQVLDPTLLVRQSIWRELIRKFPFKEKYLLIYTIRNTDDRIYEYAARIAQKLGLSVLNFSFWVTGKKDGFEGASPEQFVSAFKNADFVMTSSFHGTAFSLIFNKDFYTLRIGDGRDTRSESILNKLGLNNRMISDESGIDLDQRIDWEKVNMLLERERKDSCDFIAKAVL